MSTGVTDTEPFILRTQPRVVDAGPTRAVVEQAAAPELDNHVGVRHASALHAAGYEASRALLAAALGDLAARVEASLAESEISYTAVGLGLLTTTAEPTGEGWGDLAGALRSGDSVDLATALATVDEEGKVVARLRTTWTVALPRRG